MFRKTALVISVLSTALIVCAVAAAHDFWLVPESFVTEPGGMIRVAANSGMDFPASLGAVSPDRFERFFVAGASGSKEITELGVEGKSLLADVTLGGAGTYVIAAELQSREISLTAEQFNEYLLHDGLSSVYELRKRENILDRDAVERYTKFTKSIVRAGDVADEFPTRPVGLVVEIVPAVNPFLLAKGDTLAVTVLYRGKPLADTEVAWSYPGVGEGFAGSTKTDENGRALVPLQKAGPYVIRMIQMEWVQLPTHEWESYWASLTFEVPE